VFPMLLLVRELRCCALCFVVCSDFNQQMWSVVAHSWQCCHLGMECTSFVPDNASCIDGKRTAASDQL
jgi:hypothetical protein